MNVLIRTDASTTIGTGHVMRCLVLAKDFRKRNAHVTFICRKLPGDLIEYIESQSFEVISLYPHVNGPPTKDKESQLNWKTDVHQTVQAIKKQPNIDWLVIDHYAIDRKWERTIKPLVKKIMVIDDLADRSHDCDVLLDQNLYRNLEKRYRGLIPSNTLTLLGPTFLLLRQEFRKLPHRIKRNRTIKRLLISFGGSDPTNETMKTIKAISRIKQPNIRIDVVIGSSNQNYTAIKKYCADVPNITIHYQINYLAELMAEADLAIGAGGSTTWERCYVGLPAMTIETAPNQSEILSYLSEIGAVCHLGLNNEVTEQDINNNVRKLINHPSVLEDMSKVAKSIISGYSDGLVVKRLLKENNDD